MRDMTLAAKSLFMLDNYCQAQNIDNKIDLTKPIGIISPSVNVASLMKVVDVPVGYYTGTPQISIPLYTLQATKVGMLLSLSYNANGVRVEEDAPWTGLNWNLQAGGAIARSIMGKPDEDVNGYRQTAQTYQLATYDVPGADGGPILNNCQKKKLSHGEVDLLPDTYYLNFNGHSAKMYFDKNGIPFISPYKPWKVSGSEYSGFTVVIEDGTIYEFNLKETTRTDITGGSNDMGSNSIGTTSWFLSRVISADLSDTIKLNYSPIAYSVSSKTNDESYSEEVPGQASPTCAGTNNLPQHIFYTMNQQINSHLLSSIETNTERVELLSAQNRNDIDQLTGGLNYSLTSIKIYNKLKNEVVKEFALSYFFSKSTSVKAIDKRLFLVALKEIGRNGDSLVHTFSYDQPDLLPPRNSKAQDYWGYYNGKSNTTLIPEFKDANNNIYKGADRTPDRSYPLIGMLKQIKYPTGGTVDFSYEVNEYSFVNNINIYSSQRWDSTLAQAIETASTVSLSTPAGSVTKSFFLAKDAGPARFEYKVEGKILGDALAEVAAGGSGTVYFSTGSIVTSGLGSGDTHGQWVNSASKAYPGNGGGTVNIMASRDASTESAIINASYYKWVPANKPAVFSRIGGGVRIKRIEKRDNIDITKTEIKEFIYKLNDSTSSGMIINLPIYEGYTFYPLYCNPNGSTPYKVGNLNVFNRHATSMVALSRSQGSIIGYSKVTVLNGDNSANGKEEYYYTSTPSDIVKNGYPYTPHDSYDDLRGLLAQKVVYNNDNVILKKEETTYGLNNQSGSPNFKWIYGVKYGAQKTNIQYDAQGCPVDWSFVGGIYKIFQFWPVVAEIKESVYSLSGANTDPLIKVSKLQYSNLNLQVNMQKSYNSKGDSITINILYPVDSVDQQVYAAMVARNIVSPVINKSFYYNTKLTYKENKKYSIWSNNGFYPKNIYTQNSESPNELRLTFNNYDSYGNILEEQKANDLKQSYIWGYNNQYPIASVVNSAVKDIFHTSFEETEGNSTTGDARTGKLSRTGGYTKALSNLTAGTYILSYWQKSGSTWNYIESKISVSGTTYTISITGQIDEVRFYPATAQMTTYTYEPLIGMTSQCDVNNRITYYEYDGFGRLILVRDQDKNILKRICYNYAGQQQDCNTSYAPAAPPAPGNLTAVINTSSAVDLSWVNNAVNATVNEVYRSAGDATHYALLVTLPDNVSTYTDTQTDINTLYFYKIKAAGSGGNSEFSNEKSITTPGVSPSALSNTAPVINDIADIYVRSSSSKTVNITATDDAGDILGFVVTGLPAFAAFSENGNGTAAFHLSPVNTAPGNFSATVKVIDNYGAFSQKVINIIVVNKDTATYRVNFNNVDYPVADPLWNSFNSTKTGGVQVLANTTLYALKDETGTGSSLSVKLLNSWPQNYLGVVTGNNSGVYPDAVIATGYYFYVQASAPQKTIKLSGLKADKKYDLTFYGNRNFASDQITNYTVGAQTVTLNSRNNISNTVQISSLSANGQGEIDIVVDAAMTKYAVINAMVIKEYPNN